MKEQKILHRNFGLDVMRAVSIWAVLLRHAGYNLGLPDKLGIGGIGVEVFFVLSGFLIGGILINSLLAENSIASLKRFWIRRWFRIIPLYYLVLTLSFLLIDNSVGWNIIYYYLFLQNNFYGIDYYPVSWSLVIEEWFYIIAPIYLSVVIHLSGKNLKTILFYIVLFMVVANVMRCAYLYYSQVYGVDGNPVFRLDSLFIGVLFAFIKRVYPLSYGSLQKFKFFLLGALVFVCYLFYYTYSDAPNIITKTIGIAILSLSIGCMIPYIETIKINTRTFLQRGLFNIITLTSLLTYSLYLIHTFVYGYIIHKNILFISSQGIRQVVAVFLLYVSCFLIYKFYEKPMLNLRERFGKSSG